MRNLFFFTIFLYFSCTQASVFETLKIGVKGYLFAYPLVDFEATKVYGGSVNVFNHISYFPTPETRIIVRPNVDTLYSFAFLDISQDPLYMMMPDTNNRYYVLEIMDAWTNVFESYGKRTTGTQKQEFFITNSSWQGEVPEGFIHVISPTKNAWIAGRIQTDGDWDLQNVTEIQQKMVLRKYSEQLGNRELTSRNENNKTSPDFVVGNMTMEEFFNNFTESMKINVPADRDAPMLADLKKIGIEPGKDWNQEVLSIWDKMTLRLAVKIGQETVLKGMAVKTRVEPLTNGWIYYTDTIGNYSTNYLTRAIVAHIGMAANLAVDAVYCQAYYDEEGNELDGNNNYVLHLAKEDLPHVNAFWSLTMYDVDSYLVPNEINKYAIRDRDQLVFNQDGSLDIYIQSTKTEEGKVANWLPAPKAKFNLTLRLYWPKQSVFDKTWKPKGIAKV